MQRRSELDSHPHLYVKQNPSIHMPMAKQVIHEAGTFRCLCRLLINLHKLRQQALGKLSFYNK
jgi:hypothetical protein